MISEVKINEQTCHEISLENDYIKFACLDYGATITNISTKNKKGEFVNNVLAYKDYNDYSNNGLYVGAVIAPLPGRVKKHQVVIDDVTYTLEDNDHGNTLHGGKNTTAFKVFDYEVTDNSVILTTTIKDLECGVPGDINLKVTYTLVDNKVLINYQAKSNKDTIFGVTNHTYFNLDGESILDHELFIDSNYYMTLDDDYCGSGHMEVVTGTGHDFQKLTRIGDNLEKELDHKEQTKGLDHAYILFDGENAIKLVSKKSGKVLTCSTDEESAVIYTGNYISNEKFSNFDGFSHAGIAIETESIPNGMNTLTSDSWYLKKDTLRETTTTLEFSLLENA